MNFIEFQKNKRRELMPSGEMLAKEAQQKFGKSYSLEKDQIQKNFNKYLKELLELEFKIYKKYEKSCSEKIIKEAVQKKLLKSSGSFYKDLIANYDNIWNFFLSISQSRKTRAGGSFENHVKFLFERLDYPFDSQTFLNGRVDYVIPSESAFRKNRTACVVISIKRTLRERWRQVIGELQSTRAGKIYILTADNDISTSKVKEIKSHNVTLVVWDEYKNERFEDYHYVIGFSDFINIHLPSSRALWKSLI